MKSASIRLIAAGTLLALAGTSFAATKTFTNAGGDGLWSNAANWSGAALPEATDDVIIPAGMMPVNVDIAVSANSVVISGTREMAINNALTVPGTVTGGVVTVPTGGTFGTSRLIGSSLNISGGVLTSPLNTLNTNISIASANLFGAVVVAGTGTITGNLGTGQEVIIATRADAPTTTMTWNGSPTIAGKVSFDHAGSGVPKSTLIVQGTMTIAASTGAVGAIFGIMPPTPTPAGEMVFEPVFAGESTVRGNIISNGSITAEHRVTFRGLEGGPAASLTSSGIINVVDASVVSGPLANGSIHFQGPLYTFTANAAAPVVLGLSGPTTMTFLDRRVTADRIAFNYNGGGMFGNMTLFSSQVDMDTSDSCILILQGASSVRPSSESVVTGFGPNTALIASNQALISEATDALPAPVLTITHPDPAFSIVNLGIIATRSSTNSPASLNAVVLPLPTTNLLPFGPLGSDRGPGGPKGVPGFPADILPSNGTIQTAPVIAGATEFRTTAGLVNGGAMLIGAPTTIRGTLARFENRFLTIITENLAGLIGGVTGGPPAPVFAQARLTTNVAEVFQEGSPIFAPIIAGVPALMEASVIGAENFEVVGGRYNYISGLMLNELGDYGPGVRGDAPIGPEPALRLNGAVVDFREPPSTTGIQGMGPGPSAPYGGIFELVNVCNLVSDVQNGILARVRSTSQFPASRTDVTKTTFAIRGELQAKADTATNANITSFGPVLLNGRLTLGPRTRMSMDTLNPASTGTLNIQVQTPGTNTADIGRIDSISRFTLLGNVRFDFLDGFAPNLCSFISAPFISTTRTMTGAFTGKFPSEAAIQIFGTTLNAQVVRVARINGCACTVPNITVDPVSVTTAVGTNATFSVTATGTPAESLVYRWFRDGNPLTDGGSAPQIIGANTAELSLNNVQTGDSGTYSVTVTNACGTDNASATLLVSPPSSGCSLADLANTDGDPIPDGVIDNGDFNAFFAAFFASELLADVANTDGDPIPDGVIDNGDFNAFFAAFFAGCTPV